MTLNGISFSMLNFLRVRNPVELIDDNAAWIILLWITSQVVTGRPYALYPIHDRECPEYTLNVILGSKPSRPLV